jgi:hypothetical protein
MMIIVIVLTMLFAAAFMLFVSFGRLLFLHFQPFPGFAAGSVHRIVYDQANCR